MQAVTLEFRTEHLVLLGLVPPVFFEKYEEVELLETLRLERGWRLQLLRLRRNGPLRPDEELALTFLASDDHLRRAIPSDDPSQVRSQNIDSGW
ncbi:MAG: hypothetical protein ACHQ16_06620, partial [Candidatus Lutacidiplasmatales archaeon]